MTKITDLKEEFTSLHTGLLGARGTTNITTGEFDKNTHTAEVETIQG